MLNISADSSPESIPLCSTAHLLHPQMSQCSNSSTPGRQIGTARSSYWPAAASSSPPLTKTAKSDLSKFSLSLARNALFRIPGPSPQSNSTATAAKPRHYKVSSLTSPPVATKPSCSCAPALPPPGYAKPFPLASLPSVLHNVCSD